MTEAGKSITVSVVVPVHNGGANFRRCLASLQALNPAPDEIIIVADGDTDGSSLRAGESGFRLLRTARRQGPARARNLGAGEARGDVLFFLDADVAVPPRTVEQVRAAFAKTPAPAAVFGTYDDSPAAPGFLSQYKNLFHHYTHQTAREEASTFWAACGAVRRDVFAALGGFDGNYGQPAIEDIELGTRMKKAGYSIQLLKSLQVKHLKRWRLLSLLKAELIYRAIPWTELILRQRRFIDDLNLRTSSRISVAAAYGTLAALAAGFIRPEFFAAAGILFLVLLLLNLPLCRFFLRKRGLMFALGAFIWQGLYFLYCGLGFGLGLLKYVFGKRPPAPAH